MSARIGTKEWFVGSLFAALEAGHVTLSTEGSLLFDDSQTRTAVEAVIDDATDEHVDLTLWTDDEHGDPYEIATVRLTAAVIA